MDWSKQITDAWNKTLEGILEAGRLLIQAKAELAHGSFITMVERELPFSRQTAHKLMLVASDERLINVAHVRHLPASWGTLYELTKLDDGTWAVALERGIIRPDMERKDLASLLIERKRLVNQSAAPVTETTCTVGDLAGLSLSGERFGTIYADPPWLYENQATRAATSNHYSGMTVAQLCELPIEEIAADDAHLHLWTTNAFLFECPRIFEAWGFEFRSSLVWVKPNIGIGNYWRNSHEFLLTAIRGSAKSFADKSLKSWFECARGEHSARCVAHAGNRRVCRITRRGNPEA